MYFGDLTKINEFVWSASAWSGLGAPATQPVDMAAFWTNAEQLQAVVEADYIQASMVTADEELNNKLDELRIRQQSMFEQFKIDAGLQGGGNPISHEVIQENLKIWSTDNNNLKLDFVKKERDFIK